MEWIETNTEVTNAIAGMVVAIATVFLVIIGILSFLKKLKPSPGEFPELKQKLFARLEHTTALLEDAHGNEKQKLQQKITQLQQQIDDFAKTEQDYQDLQKRIGQLVGLDPESQRLFAAAQKHITDLEFTEADQLLQQAEDLDMQAIEQQQHNLDERKIHAAYILAGRAQLAQLQLDMAKSVLLYDRAIAFHDQDFVMLIAASRAYRTRGRLDNARAYAEKALQVAQAAQNLRDITVANDDIGDIYAKSGDLKAANKAYENARKISKQLAQSDPSNTQWQIDLAESYGKIADVDKQRRAEYRQNALDILMPLEAQNRLDAHGKNALEWVRNMPDG